MGLLEKFRAGAAELREAANTLLSAEDLATNHKKQIAAVVGQVNANVLEALAELAEYLGAESDQSDRAKIVKRIMEKNDAIRRAAAKGHNSGDWTDFDRLAGESPGEPGGSGASQG